MFEKSELQDLSKDLIPFSFYIQSSHAFFLRTLKIFYRFLPTFFSEEIELSTENTQRCRRWVMRKVLV